MYDPMDWTNLLVALLRLIGCSVQRIPASHAAQATNRGSEVSPPQQARAMRHELDDVRKRTYEFAYQYSWTVSQKRENYSLVIARALLEISLAAYKVERRKRVKS